MDDRINKIYRSDKFQYSIKKIGELEADRIFCRHNLQHFLDVARIAYIMCLEQGLNIKKDIVYAAALLHDIGRWLQYEQGIPHETASSSLAYDILTEAGYDKGEIEYIQKAIISHRSSNENIDLCGILYKSDKLSRACYMCSAQKECNWSAEKKNKGIVY